MNLVAGKSDGREDGKVGRDGLGSLVAAVRRGRSLTGSHVYRYPEKPEQSASSLPPTVSILPQSPPPGPTTALPGSEEKIRVMAWRAANGFALHHPDDATFEDVAGPAAARILLNWIRDGEL